MKKFTLITLLFLSILTLASGNLEALLNGKEDDDSQTEEPQIEYGVIVSDLEQIDIEIDETYNLSYIVKANSGMVVSALDDGIVTIKDNVLTGTKKGETNIELKLENKIQKVRVVVHDKGALSSTFTFDKASRS